MSIKKGRWDSDSDDEKEFKRKIKKEKKLKKDTLSIPQESCDIFNNILSNNNYHSSIVSLQPIAHKVSRCRSVDCYEPLNYIDEGTYGMVFRARCIESREIYALKQVKLGPEVSKVGFPHTALREINILLALNHPNIVKVKEMVMGTQDKIYMVMEYCENDLKTCMKQNKQSFSTAEVIYLNALNLSF